LLKFLENDSSVVKETDDDPEKLSIAYYQIEEPLKRKELKNYLMENFVGDFD
jgi:hypothetical protein